ncbi:MAG: hypothetical protein IPF87_01795 [Gemmatimonadetes bacterium]|jgi:hypothetical protein|nr:hypothetical protein [Gemmatimonadota bacterium]MBP9106677.1 hypothetical protein [Gemmatimonadaceae bacterium]MBK6840999.1 hypothetical protein [Gemmatimonadota bacterium]MBK7834679.1 hypothetical protein [Gemmatimonadota bacterium]MBK8056570.1 hypothetical protein [Gemmatimonadota bacterium]
MSFRTLDATHIIATIERLGQRIEERFPGAGLSGVGRDLLGLARDCAREAESLGRPHWPIRAGVGLAIVLMVVAVIAAVVGVVQRLSSPTQVSGLAEFVQGVESGVNDLVFLGIAVYFLISIETRLKRRVALRRIHQLRSIAHIVDMHQLTKDPERLLATHQDTASSPQRTMTRAELWRYLDYCSELLSLTGKIGALFVQRMDDAVVLQAVNEIEDLTNGLSRKIWQKITLLERTGDAGGTS